MGILTRDEIDRRLKQGQLLTNPRVDSNGQYEIESASYDLTAERAVWKEPARTGRDSRVEEGKVKELRLVSGAPLTSQPMLTVQPGAIVFVMTVEDVSMPSDIYGTVYSKNGLAMEGILALNAGHIDPGYKGPIVIRLINFRSVPWVLTLGTPIFTIVFHTIEYSPDDTRYEHEERPREATLLKVRQLAERSLSNALFDLYDSANRAQLQEYFARAQSQLKQELTEVFVRRGAVWSELGRSLGRTFRAAIFVFAAIASITGVILTALIAIGVLSFD